MKRYADASSQKGLQELMSRLNAVMKINVKKTEVRCISRKSKRKVHLLIEDQQVEQLSQFKYLGSWISDDGYATEDI